MFSSIRRADNRSLDFCPFRQKLEELLTQGVADGDARAELLKA
jgi:hypothetical protein